MVDVQAEADVAGAVVWDVTVDGEFAEHEFELGA